MNNKILVLLLLLLIYNLVCINKKESFQNLIDNSRTLYNRHKRNIRKAVGDSSIYINSSAKTRMRKAGL